MTPTAPEKLSAEAAAAAGQYAARWQRVLDTIALRRPDRMPTSLIGSFWFARYGGISYRQLMYDYAAAKDICERAVLDLDPDVYGPITAPVTIGPILEGVDFKQLQWPGHGTGDNTTYQYLDREYMSAAEYDDFIFDPTGFFLEKYLPRVAGAYSGLSDLAQLSQSYYTAVASASRIFSRPHVLGALAQLRAAGEETDTLYRHTFDLIQRLTARGYPEIAGGHCQAPYDVLADYMRGAKNVMMDLYRRKDQVLAALDKLGVLILKGTLASATRARSPIVVIPIHWGPDNFMSPAQFATFFWPSLRKLMMGLIEHGLVPMPLWESVCTRRLEVIADVPKGTCLYWFESTDLVHARTVFGDTIALYGNIPASLLTTQGPEAIDAAVRHLAENIFHKGGSLILSTSTPLPDETPIANARALYQAARKYGT